MDERKEQVAKLLRETIAPANGPAPTINIERLYVVIPGNSAVELITALRQLLKEQAH